MNLNWLFFRIFFPAFLWDIFLSNEKDTSSFSGTDVSKFNTAFFFYSIGNVHHNRELLSNVRCAMDLRKYPHDVQVCTKKFESFFYWVTEVKFQNESVSSREFSSPTFEIVVEGAESGST